MAENHGHDDGCLEYAARVHLGYELRHLGSMAAARTTQQAELAATALFEGLLVHARVLNEFLTRQLPPKRKYPEQLCASDYIGSEWHCTTALTEEQYDLICRRVVHMYCDRSEGAPWTETAPRLEIARVLLAGFTEFVDHLRSVYPDRAEWFEEGLRDGHHEFALSEAGAYAFARVVPSPNGATFG